SSREAWTRSMSRTRHSTATCGWGKIPEPPQSGQSTGPLSVPTSPVPKQLWQRRSAATVLLIVMPPHISRARAVTSDARRGPRRVFARRDRAQALEAPAFGGQIERGGALAREAPRQDGPHLLRRRGPQ